MTKVLRGDTRSFNDGSYHPDPPDELSRLYSGNLTLEASLGLECSVPALLGVCNSSSFMAPLLESRGRRTRPQHCRSK